jgi:hypothetical protein
MVIDCVVESAMAAEATGALGSRLTR